MELRVPQVTISVFVNRWDEKALIERKKDKRRENARIAEYENTLIKAVGTEQFGL